MSRNRMAALGLFLFVVLVLCIAILPEPLAQASAPGASWRSLGAGARIKATTDARTSLLQAYAGIFLLATLLVAWQQLRVARQGQSGERLAKAIELLGHDQRAVRVGAIYSLRHLASEAPETATAVSSILLAYAHDRASVPAIAQDVDFGPEPLSVDHPDLQGALSVLGDPLLHFDSCKFDLSGRTFTSADLAGAHFAGSALAAAELSHADLSGSALNGAMLNNACLDDADLRGANLSRASLQGGCSMRNANLTNARLRGAAIGAACFEARFDGADLRNADLHQADVAGASFRGADVRGANFRHCFNLPDNTPRVAIWNKKTTWPEGLDPGRQSAWLPRARRTLRHALQRP